VALRKVFEVREGDGGAISVYETATRPFDSQTTRPWALFSTRYRPTETDVGRLTGSRARVRLACRAWSLPLWSRLGCPPPGTCREWLKPFTEPVLYDAPGPVPSPRLDVIYGLGVIRYQASLDFYPHIGETRVLQDILRNLRSSRGDDLAVSALDTSRGVVRPLGWGLFDSRTESYSPVPRFRTQFEELITRQGDKLGIRVVPRLGRAWLSSSDRCTGPGRGLHLTRLAKSALRTCQLRT